MLKVSKLLGFKFLRFQVAGFLRFLVNKDSGIRRFKVLKDEASEVLGFKDCGFRIFKF
jgi:hypothetical protein